MSFLLRRATPVVGILFLLVALLPHPCMGADGSRPQVLSGEDAVEVGVLNNFPPFAFVVRGKLMGFTVDYLNLLSEKTGIEFEFVSGTWEDNLGRFKRGDVELITAMSYTRDRTRFTRFTEPYYRIPTVVYQREDSFNYGGVNDLRGKVVGIEADVYYKKYLAEYPEITVREIEDTNELMKQLSFGNLDAVITNINIGDYMTKKHVLENVTVAGGIDIAAIEDEDLRIGVRREYGELHRRLENGMNRISPSEYKEIQDRWVGFTPSEITDVLMPAERTVIDRYASRYGGIRLAVHADWYPIDFINDEGEHAGVAADLLDAISGDHGIPFVLEPTNSFDEAVRAVVEGEVDLLPAVAPTPELRKELSFSKPYLSLPIVIATRSSEFFIGDPGNLAGKNVGILERGALPSVLAERYGDIAFNGVASTREGLRRVRDGEDFAFVGTVPAIAHAIQKHGFYNIKIDGRFEERRTISAAVDRGNRELLSVIEKVFQAMPLEEREALVDRWISVSFEERVDRSFLWRVLIVAAAVAVVVALWIRKVQGYNVALSRAYSLLEEKNAELEQLSVTNQLTGLYNRNKLDAELEREMERSRRYGSRVSVVMLDVDWFKSINDRFGHQTGDVVLRDLSARIKERVRSADIAGRWGGEEFLVLCPETGLEGAAELAEALREDVEARCRVSGEPVTVSVGVVECRSGDSAEAIIRRVDDRLYEAKRRGKNRVVAADPREAGTRNQ